MNKKDIKLLAEAYIKLSEQAFDPWQAKDNQQAVDTSSAAAARATPKYAKMLSEPTNHAKDNAARHVDAAIDDFKLNKWPAIVQQYTDSNKTPPPMEEYIKANIKKIVGSYTDELGYNHRTIIGGRPRYAQHNPLIPLTRNAFMPPGSYETEMDVRTQEIQKMLKEMPPEDAARVVQSAIDDFYKRWHKAPSEQQLWTVEIPNAISRYNDNVPAGATYSNAISKIGIKTPYTPKSLNDPELESLLAPSKTLNTPSEPVKW